MVALDEKSAADEPLRLLAVHAHPDDEASKGAATMAYYVASGVQVMVATCTGGERGDVLNPAMDRPDVKDNIPTIRRSEMAASQQIIGFEHAWLGFVDSGMPEGELPADSFAAAPVAEAAGPLVALMREFRPHVVLTYDENGGYPHPDHIMCHQVSMAAFEAAGDPAAYPDAGAPWQPLKLYYHLTFTKARVVALHEALLAENGKSPYGEWLDEWFDGEDMSKRITTRVQCGDFFEQRDAALLAHATQVDPKSFWFAASPELQRRVWPTEDFELARSLVDSPIPEDDLFAGIRE